METFRQGVVALLHRDGECLLVRKVGCEEWQLPAGGKEPTESLLETLQRELDEELGLAPADIRKVTPTGIVHTYRWGQKFVQKTGHTGQRQEVMLVELTETATPKADGVELEEIRFVPQDALTEHITFDDLKETVEQALERIP